MELDFSIVLSERKDTKKKILMITHAKCQQLFDVMVSFVFCLGPGYCLKPCARRRNTELVTKNPPARVAMILFNRLFDLSK